MVVKLADGGWLGAGGQQFATADEAHASFARGFKWPKPKLTAEQRLPSRRLRIFLCHAREDKPVIRALHKRLNEAGTQPWLDEVDLLPGQKWKTEIRKAISEADAFLACLSSRAITREGFVHREIREALERALSMPEGRIFLIPVRLDACNVPEPLKEYQWVDYFGEKGPDYLMRALEALADHLNNAGASVRMPDYYS